MKFVVQHINGNMFKSLLAGLITALCLIITPKSVNAEIEETWVNIDDRIEMRNSNPIRNLRSRDARVLVAVKNTSGEDIRGPIRLVLTDLFPASVVIANADGQTSSGHAYYDLTPYIGDVFEADESTGRVEIVITNGGRFIFNFIPVVEQQSPDF